MAHGVSQNHQMLCRKAINCYTEEARLDKDEYHKLWKEYQQLDLYYQRMPPKLMEIMIDECQNLN